MSVVPSTYIITPKKIPHKDVDISPLWDKMDLIIPEIAKYKAVLGTQYREFSKAIGLFAHGIGIGSFVYLRRIIENLVFDNPPKIWKYQKRNLTDLSLMHKKQVN